MNEENINMSESNMGVPIPNSTNNTPPVMSNPASVENPVITEIPLPVENMVSADASAPVEVATAGGLSFESFSNPEPAVQETPTVQQNFDTTLTNPAAEVNKIKLSDTDEGEYEEVEEYEEEKTEDDIRRERRNSNGLRFIIIFGLLVLAFIIMLPYIYKLF